MIRSFFKDSPLNKGHVDDEVTGKYAGLYLNIFKLPGLPDNIDKAADEIVKALEYLEQKYKGK